MDYSDFLYEYLPKKIIFLTGGPGCGKGTLCENLIKHLGYI